MSKKLIETGKTVLKKAIIPLFIVMPISVVLALLLAEKMVRYANPQFTYTQAKLVSLKAYAKSDTLPFSLLPNTTTTHIGNTHEFSYTIKTNSKGYRMEDFTEEKPYDEYRILMLGDSLAFGFGVEQNESFVSLLNDKLNKYLIDNSINGKKIKIINAGFVDGKSPDSYYLYLKNQGLKLKPDLIIANYFVNNDVMDLDDMIWEKVDSDGLPTKISMRTSFVDPPYYRLKQEYQNWKLAIPIIRNSHLWILFSTAWETKSPQTVNTIRNVIKNKDLPTIGSAENYDCIFREKCTQKMEDLLKRFYLVSDGLVKLSKDNNVPLLVSLLPANPQVEELAKVVDADNRYPKLSIEEIRNITQSANPQKNWAEFFAKQNIPLLDTLPYMVDSGWQTLYFHQDGHPNINGQRRFSNAFYDYLIDEWKILDRIQN